jgi:NAD(P)-dependent dehydrogenase (short-subunit alcohol dehydrogenase family)
VAFRLDGKVAIVTAAGQGIGAASGSIMASLGATVVVADINEKGAQETAKAINAAGGKASAAYMDARQEASVRSLIEDTHNKYGRLDILHNNAGGTWLDRDRQAADIAQDAWDEIFAWNMDCTHWGCKYAIPLMIAGGGGSIVNTVTAGAAFAQSNQIVYGTAKAAVASYTRYVAVQYGWRNVRCNGVAPGLILTPHATEVMSKEFLNGICKHTTTARVGKPEDIGYAVAFLASDVAGYINGQILTVDGGVSVRFPHDAGVLEMQGYGPEIPTPTLPKMPG